MNQGILDWQNSFGNFGISYSGPKDGLSNPEFVLAMLNLERKYSAYGKIFSGSKILMNPDQVKKSFGPKEEPAKQPTEKSPENQPKDNSAWESFFAQTLPFVGKLSGDLSSSAKQLESAIGKAINKPTAGLIWNEQKQTFNTTPDDVMKALNLLAIKKSSV